MKVAMMQPTFLPWLGYFELIAKSDKFVFLDDFQFVYQSYHQKNRLFVNKEQSGWYIVPIDKKKSFQQPLNLVVIKEDLNWRNKMWRRIEANYKKAPYYSEFAYDIEKIVLTPEISLLKQNMKFIEYFCRVLGYQKKFLYSSQMNLLGKKSGVVKNILEQVGATTYLSAHGSFEYMYDDKVFPLKNIDVLFQNFNPIPYKQIGSKQFVPYLSILDALFNIGIEKVRNLIDNGTQKWLFWNEMVDGIVDNIIEECDKNEE